MKVLGNRISQLVLGLAMVSVALAAPGIANAEEGKVKKGPRTVGVVLYPGFELLDVYGPVEMFGMAGKFGLYEIAMIAQEAGEVASYQGPKVIADYGFADAPEIDILLVPGGFGTIPQLNNPAMLDFVRGQHESAELVTSVCSGSAILAKAGVLNGSKATSNKVFFSLASNQGPEVEWVEQARWVDDGKVVTSSGVSAGIDMALAIIERLNGEGMATRVAKFTEYKWHRDADSDPFAEFLNTAQALPKAPVAEDAKKRRMGFLLLEGFETLDIMGPLEMFGNLPGVVEVVMVGLEAGPVASTHGVKVVAQYSLEDCPPLDLILVPGGDVMDEAEDERLLSWIRERTESTELMTSVCTGTAVLANAGILDGRRVTTNKMAFKRVSKMGTDVDWVAKARWVDDGNIITSSGVSAGIDMSLAVIARLYGEPVAVHLANLTEYQWHRDADDDPFAK